MKNKILSVCLLSMSLGTYAANNINIQIKGPQAKTLYNGLTGPMVQAEGAAGHSYKNGKNVICRYVNAPMDDKNGQAIPNLDVRRYTCLLHFDRNGIAYPG